MCDYCKTENNGDIALDCKELFHKKIAGFEVCSLISDENSNFDICFIADGETIDSFEVSCNYCPMCGRKLGAEEREQKTN